MLSLAQPLGDDSVRLHPKDEPESDLICPSIWRCDLAKSPACRRTRRCSTIGADLTRLRRKNWDHPVWHTTFLKLLSASSCPKVSGLFRTRNWQKVPISLSSRLASARNCRSAFDRKSSLNGANISNPQLAPPLLQRARPPHA
jgi:hypothetical protein